MTITVDIQEVKDRWRGPGEIPYTDAQIQTDIDDAITELREHIPNLDSLVETGRIRQESIDKIVAKAVIGAWRNAEGFKSESDGGYSYSRYGDGFVWFRQSDIDRLIGKSVQFGTIRTGLPCGWQ